ncbi:MAG: Jag N-terminal domain-containing protein [Candidatus Omnitrophota bacterium]|nr:Jag N-terminal domain-containing protein [Candidatus Omnitrophota bacterium]
MNEPKKRSIEVEAVTVSAAIKKALKVLKAKETEVTIEVLKEEHKGLFGMKGADFAKIRATLTDKKNNSTHEAS